MRTIAILLLALVAAGCAHQVTAVRPPMFSLQTSDSQPVYDGAIQKRTKEFDSLLRLCAGRRDSLGKEYNRLSRAAWHWDFWTSCLGIVPQGVSSVMMSTGGSERAARNISITGATLIALSLGVKTASCLGARLAERSAEYQRWDGFIGFSIDEFVRMQRFLDSQDSLKLMDDLLIKMRRQSERDKITMQIPDQGKQQ